MKRITVLLSLVLGLALSAFSARADQNITGAYVALATSGVQNTIDGQPLQITFDIVGTSNPVVTANLTNSACANTSSAFVSTSLTRWSNGALKTIKFVGTDGSAFTFTTSTGTFTESNGNCGAGESGHFTLSTETSPEGLYTGTLDGNTGTNNDPHGYTGAPTTVNFVIDGNFLMKNTTVNITAALCSGGPRTENLTVNAAADATGGFTSMQIGNVLYFNATDGNNTIGFIGTPVGADGNTSPTGQWYVTYYVYSGVCAGSQGLDAPFSKKQSSPRSPRLPIHIGPRGRLASFDR